MIKILRLVVAVVAALGFSLTAYGQFPYIESFRTSVAPGITFGGSPSAFLTAAGSAYENGIHVGAPIDPTGNGFLRLTSNANNQKGFAISNATFPSTDGLSVEFEYYIYGGSGADGISFFLFDANASPFNIGSFGGSLGYAQITNPVLSPGVSKGYLAVGLDEYGNFSNPTEGRQGGAPTPSFKPGSVTLRGKGDGSALTPENYKWLATAQEFVDFPFNLVGGGTGRVSDPTNPGYRKVLMLMEPNPLGGYNITVKITRGGVPQLEATVINKYYYPDSAPSLLRYGFASSTGFFTNFHEVRNVTIDILDPVNVSPPVAANDAVTVCQNLQANINVAGNDVTNNNGGEINKSSIDLDPTTAGVQTTFSVAARGVFAVTTGGFVQFTPSTSFTGPVTCSYTIKDTFGATSNNATITVNYTEAPAMPTAGTDQLINIVNSPTSTTLVGSNPGANAGVWSQISGPNTAVFANATSSSTTASNLISGVYIFRWSVRSTGGCELFDDVQVIINHRPIANNDATSTNLNVDVNIPILNNDTDLEGNGTIQKNSIVIYNQPQRGTLVVDNATGVVTYKPNPGFSGTDTFTYSIKDAYGVESNIATATIAVNVKPTGLPDVATTTAQTRVDIKVLDNDPVLPGITVVKNSDPANGTVVLNPDGTFTYSPRGSFSGTDTFTYRVVNKDGLQSDPILVTVTVKPSGSKDRIETPASTPVIFPVKDNDLSKEGTSVIVTINPTNGRVALNAAGVPVYTPNTEFSGADIFTYILRTAEGIESEPITASIIVKPVGAPDNVSTPFNVPITIPVKTNDVSKVGTTVVTATPPTRGTVSIDANGNMTYQPNDGFAGTDTYTYILRTADGVESDPITVNVTVRPRVVIPAPNVTTDAVSGDPKIIEITVPAGGSVTIVTPPKNGTITFDPATGRPIYTPNPGYTGPDDFIYIIKDADGNQSNPATVTLTVTPALLPAKIGLAKALVSTIKNVDGSYDLTYRFTIVNSGQIAISNVRLTDNLAATFPGATVTVKRLEALGTLNVNNGFNGTSNTQMLLNTSILRPSSKEEIEMTITVSLGDQDGEFRNLAIVSGNSAKTGALLEDQSTNGLNPDPQTAGDYSPNLPTPVTLTNPLPAKIGLAKALVSSKKNIDGSYEIKYKFTIVNSGEVAVNNASLTDNLTAAFPGATVKVKSLEALGTLSVNRNYNGTSDTQMLASPSLLRATSKEEVELTITVAVGTQAGEFRNSALVSGNSVRNGALVEDQSTNGFNPDSQTVGDYSPNTPTPVILTNDGILIPGGFSPNGDGINDFFVIENAIGKQLTLEVFNRWANRIYRASAYQNNWNGKTTEGIHVGDDVPPGTYYYILTIDNKEKRVGYITINR